MNRSTARSYSTAILGGLAAAILFVLSAPPYGYSYAAWAVPGALLLAALATPVRAAFCAGLTYGAVSAALIGVWLPEALVAQYSLPTVAGMVVYTLVVIASGTLFGFATAGCALAAPRLSRTDLAIVATFFWLACEWVSAQSLGWLVLGHSQFNELWLIQVADLGGVHAVSFVLAFTSVTLAIQLTALLARQTTTVRAMRSLALPMATLMIAVSYGVIERDGYRIDPVEHIDPVAQEPETSPFSLAFDRGSIRAASLNDRETLPAAKPQLRVRRVATVQGSGLRVGPLSCRDVLDSAVVEDVVRDGADVLISNCREPWIGSASSSQAEQHLAVAVFRSVETRRFLLRSTNDGDGELVSAIGETFAERPNGLSMSLSSEATTYMTYGDRWICFGFGLSLVVIGRGRRDSDD